MNVLSTYVTREVTGSDSPAKAAENVAFMFDEAKKYVAGMVRSLPAIAFKAETISPTVKKSGTEMKKCKSCGANCAEELDKCPDCGADPMAEPTAKEETCPECGTPKADQPTTKEDGEDVCKACGTKKKKPEMQDASKKDESVAKEDSLTIEQVSAIVQSKMDSVMEALVKKMEDMVASITTKVDTSIADISTKVEAAETVAKAANEKVSGIVVSGGDSDDHDKVQKNERVGFGGREIDTAFMPRIRKASR